MQQLRQNPRNLDAEESVIGGLLFHGQAFDRVSGVIDAEDFYDARHSAIFAAMTDLAAVGQRIDLLTVAQEMRRNGTMARLETSGAEAFLSDLSVRICTIEGISAHARMVREQSYLRRLIEATARIQDRAYANEEPAEAIIEAAQVAVLGLADVTQRKEPVLLRQIIHETVNELDRRTKSPGAVNGLPSGIEELDEILQGAQPGHLDIIAARPGMGKTALVLSWALHAGEKGHPGLIFSVEMPKEELGMRAISGVGRVDNSLMRSGLLTGDDWIKISKAANIVAPLPIWIDDDGRQDLFSIGAKARRWRQNRKAFPTGNELGFIVVDYLQLLKAARRKGGQQSREREVAELSSGLKALAKQLQVPVLALSSLNRECEKRTDKRPMMSDLKESGAIEADADVVMLIYRDEVYNPNPRANDKNAKDNAGIAEICVAKHRGGATGTIECQYQKEYTLFRRLSKRDQWTPGNY